MGERVQRRGEEGVKSVQNARKKRVQRVEKIMVAVMIALIVLPSVFCLILALRIRNLERQVKELKEEQHKSLEIVWDNEAAFYNHTVDDMNQKKIEEDLPAEGLKKVYLTFDDGPSIYTKEILDILKRYNVKATFFVTGMNSPQYDEYYQAIIEDGHAMGIHTYSHEYGDIYESLEAFQADFHKMQDYLYKQTGQQVRLYRFPGGSANTAVSAEVRSEIFQWLEEEGIEYYDWNVSSGDAEKTVLSPETMAQNCIEGVKNCNTAIVLLHDASGKKGTIEALPLIIEGINQLDDTVLLPMDEETVKIQQIKSTNE